MSGFAAEAEGIRRRTLPCHLECYLVKPVFVAAAVFLFGFGPDDASAQERLRPEPIDVRACALADTLLGEPIGHLPTRLLTIPTPEGNVHLFTRPRGPGPGATGLADFGLSADVTSDTTALPSVALQLRVTSPVARSIEQRQLILYADSNRLDLGSMTAATQQWPGVEGVVENMVTQLPFHHLTSLARAERISGVLGTLEFTVPEARREDLRTFWVALVCDRVPQRT